MARVLMLIPKTPLMHAEIFAICRHSVLMNVTTSPSILTIAMDMVRNTQDLSGLERMSLPMPVSVCRLMAHPDAHTRMKLNRLDLEALVSEAPSMELAFPGISVSI